MKERRIDLESVDVSIEALDGLLLNDFVRVESASSLLKAWFNLSGSAEAH
jgi:hypothetical protein